MEWPPPNGWSFQSPRAAAMPPVRGPSRSWANVNGAGESNHFFKKISARTVKLGAAAAASRLLPQVLIEHVEGDQGGGRW
jgi:hypothetical protein